MARTSKLQFQQNLQRNLGICIKLREKYDKQRKYLLKQQLFCDIILIHTYLCAVYVCDYKYMFLKFQIKVATFLKIFLIYKWFFNSFLLLIVFNFLNI